MKYFFSGISPNNGSFNAKMYGHKMNLTVRLGDGMLDVLRETPLFCVDTCMVYIINKPGGEIKNPIVLHTGSDFS